MPNVATLPSGTQLSVVAAKALFLFGDPATGKRYRTMRELGKAVGVAPTTLSAYRKEWEAELYDLGKHRAGILTIPEKDLQKHNADLEFLRGELSKVQARIESGDLPEAGPPGTYTLKMARTEWAALQARWFDASGMKGFQDSQTARLKQMQKDLGKADAKVGSGGLVNQGKGGGRSNAFKARTVTMPEPPKGEADAPVDVEWEEEE